VDRAPFVLFGRDASVADVVIDDDAVSRRHAALVHHNDGRVYVIDLASVSSPADGCCAARCRGRALHCVLTPPPPRPRPAPAPLRRREKA
jgi:hypothetical protein